VPRKHTDHSPKAQKFSDVFTVDLCESLIKEFELEVNSEELREVLTEIHMASESMKDSDERKPSAKQMKAIYTDISKWTSSLDDLLQRLSSNHVIALTKENVTVDDLETLKSILPELAFTASNLADQTNEPSGRNRLTYIKYLCAEFAKTFKALSQDPRDAGAARFIKACFDALDIFQDLDVEAQLERINYHLKGFRPE
jgi:hypothetical protein